MKSRTKENSLLRITRILVENEEKFISMVSKAFYLNKVTRSRITSNLRIMEYSTLFILRNDWRKLQWFFLGWVNYDDFAFNLIISF